MNIDFKTYHSEYKEKVINIFAFVGVFTNKSESILLVKTPTKAKNYKKIISIYENQPRVRTNTPVTSKPVTKQNALPPKYRK
jgi:hypothetical protein